MKGIEIHVSYDVEGVRRGGNQQWEGPLNADDGFHRLLKYLMVA